MQVAGHFECSTGHYLFFFDTALSFAVRFMKKQSPDKATACIVIIFRRNTLFREPALQTWPSPLIFYTLKLNNTTKGDWINWSLINKLQ